MYITSKQCSSARGSFLQGCMQEEYPLRQQTKQMAFLGPGVCARHWLEHLLQWLLAQFCFSINLFWAMCRRKDKKNHVKIHLSPSTKRLWDCQVAVPGSLFAFISSCWSLFSMMWHPCLGTCAANVMVIFQNHYSTWTPGLLAVSSTVGRSRIWAQRYLATLSSDWLSGVEQSSI